MDKDKINADEIKKALKNKKKIKNTYDPSTFPGAKNKNKKIKSTYDPSTFPGAKDKNILDQLGLETEKLPKIKNTYGPNRTSQKSDKQNLRSGGRAGYKHGGAAKRGHGCEIK